jgi:hypothetical protein
MFSTSCKFTGLWRGCNEPYPFFPPGRAGRAWFVHMRIKTGKSPRRKTSNTYSGVSLADTTEILAITGLTIIEKGESGEGARFEIIVLKGA